MRIAVVSAHYPPNFTSGGTLVPQRCADELGRRGHQVHVFAGAYATGDPDGTTWTECTESGVTIHWIATTGMLGWGSEENYTNPRVEAAFAEFLREVRPEVVHLHSLQGMGGGLVTLAKAAGCATVLTMHDMWWWCARQFLADRNLRPCTGVVACGVCPCERDNGWLTHRNRTLAAHLDSADLVLAPSSAMVDLLRANGVDPDRLALDENPTVTGRAPDLPTETAHPDHTDHTDRAHRADPPDHTDRGSLPERPVRFVYASGPNPVKGAEVMVRAARLLADLSGGWTLDCYGLDPAADLPPGVRALPPYDSGRVGTVLSGYHVLLLPSIMIESYSLLTREALDAGLAVVVTQNPGPLEVVRDGENGLVVPRGDAAGMAEAMRSLVDDPALLRRLRPEPGSIRLRSLAEQVDGLEERYAALVTAIRSTGPTSPAGETATAPATTATARPARPIRRVLLLTGINGAPLRYRGRLPQEALAPMGVQVDVRVYRDIEAPTLARGADAVVIYRSPATEQLLDLIGTVRARPEPVPILFDVDDLIVDPAVEPELADVLVDLSAADRELYWRGVSRYRTTLEACDGYIGSTQMLCEEIARLTGMPTYRYANGVGIQLARASDAALRHPRRHGPPAIGYLSGTDTHNEDWAYVEPAVCEVMRRRPEVRLVIGGLLSTGPALHEFSGRISRLPMMPWYQLPAVLRGLDVNLAPLAPARRFNEAKSAIKYLEAALVETPTVASPTQPFREAIEDGVTGLLAESPEGFVEAICSLLDRGDTRHRIGAAARRQALLTLSPARQGPRYLAILEQARDHVQAHGHRALFGSGWEPVYDSEAYIPIAPEDYGPAPLVVESPADPLGARTIRRLANDYRVSAVRYLRTEGTLPTIRKTAQVISAAPSRLRRRANGSTTTG